MNQLVKLITEKTGLDEKMAKQIVDVVSDYLAKTLPAPLNQNVDKLLSGDTSAIAQIPGLGKKGGLGGLLSGLLGGKR